MNFTPLFLFFYPAPVVGRGIVFGRFVSFFVSDLGLGLELVT